MKLWKTIAVPSLMAFLVVMANADQTQELVTDADLTKDIGVARATLEKVLVCEYDADPDEVVALVKSLGGVAIIKGMFLPDSHYTIPAPIVVFGRPVTQISVTGDRNVDGKYPEYISIFSGEPLSTVARLADVEKDENGVYLKHIDGHDLILREVGDSTYVTCAQDVRTIRKTIARTLRDAWAALSE